MCALTARTRCAKLLGTPAAPARPGDPHFRKQMTLTLQQFTLYLPLCEYTLYLPFLEYDRLHVDMHACSRADGVSQCPQQGPV